MSYGRALQRLADAEGDRVAVVCEGEALTRAELAGRANALAAHLAERGVGKGGLVSIGLPNGLDFIVASVAAWKLGAVPNPLSPRLPIMERDAILELAQPAMVIGFDDPPAGFPVLVDYDWQSRSDDPPDDVVPPNERALASGGSTGRPKLIVLANPARHDPDRPANVLTPDGTVLVPGPMYHAAPFGSMTQAILSGETVVVMKRFDASECLALVERHRVQQVLFVPTMMHRIMRLPEEERRARDVSSLKLVLTGSAPCPQWLMRAFIDWLGPDVMCEVFGGSERIGGTFITGREWLEHPGSVGRPTPATEMRILDPETGEPTPVGAVGEIYMRPLAGPGSTYRYVGSEARATEDGWESLGDMGRVDEEGYLYLADRRTDMILSGGRNIYPAQVEAALESHPGVMSSAVIGLPDEDMGARVHAIVQCEVGIDEAELHTHLEERLVRYAHPRSYEFVDEPLRDEAGKVRRFALREARL